MNRLFLNQIILPLKNERGIAALMGVIFGIIIISSIAFNFMVESRQKQTGSILTYTSTNAFMIAEAGLRYAEKCLLKTEPTGETWSCPAAIYNQTDWTTITTPITFNHDFGDGNFAISLPGNASDDEDNIFVVATGTFKGGQRSIQRFISRTCVLSLNGATSCLGTTTNNNSIIDPEPDPSATGVCPTNPPGIVDPVVADSACIGCPTTGCPDFSAASHLDGSNFLTQATFCTMTISGTTIVRTSEGEVGVGVGNSDDNIYVEGNFSISGTASLRLSDDAADPNNSDETIITVLGDATLTNGGDIRVNGAMTLLVGGKFDMKNSSRINNTQGVAANVSTLVEGNATIKNSALYIGALFSDGTISLQNNADFTGSLQGDTVQLRNNASLTFDEDGGESTTGNNQCLSSDVPPGWSE